MTHSRVAILAVSLIMAAAVVTGAEEAHPEGRNVAQMKFVNFPAFPTCAPGSVQNGDPATGPSIIYAKASAGCTVPWHWHTPTEHLMIVSGTARVQTKGGKSVTLRPGGFMLLPSHHVHQFRCPTACTLYVYSDTAFDIHYVDKEGKEIPAADALKSVGEKAITP